MLQPLIEQERTALSMSSLVFSYLLPVNVNVSGSEVQYSGDSMELDFFFSLVLLIFLSLNMQYQVLTLWVRCVIGVDNSFLFFFSSTLWRNGNRKEATSVK